VFRSTLRTLLIVLALGPMAIWGIVAFDCWLYPPDPEFIGELPDLGTCPVGDLVIPVVDSEPLFDPGGPPDKMIQDWREPQR
jgi:hypothetical protein